MVTVQARIELKNNIRICALLCIVLFAVIGIRAWFLQVLCSPELTRTLQRQHKTSVLLAPKRGTIYDRNGNELAISIQVESLGARPHLISDPEKVSGQLGAILSVSPSAIAAKLRTQKSFVWIERKITPQQSRAIRDLQEPGLDLLPASKRSYPNGELAGQLIGFTGLDSEGLEGIEFQLNNVLAGTPQRVAADRDAKGRRLFSEGFSRPIKGDGNDVYLTIDKTIQYIAEKELQTTVEATRAKNGIAIVMDPWTGDVLAMAVAPLFDPNRYSHYRPAVWRNRAVTDVLEPGSTFKIFVVAAALEEQIITPQDSFFCENGKYRVAGRTINDVHPYGWLNVAHIIKYSSNIGVSKISKHLGMPVFYQYIRKFGFDQTTGIQLPGEASGIVPLPVRLPEHTRSAIAFGHSISVTPLQLAQAYSAIANGGVLMQANVVRSIGSQQASGPSYGSRSKGERVIAPATAQLLAEMLHSVVESGGTGVRAAVPGFGVAGKTGTARKIYNGVYSNEHLVASFAGFCPVDNPRFTVVVIIDEPEVMSYGGQSAAPAFSRISQQVLNYMNVAPRVQLAADEGFGHAPAYTNLVAGRSG